MVPPLGLGKVGNSWVPSWKTTELTVPAAKLVPPPEETDGPGGLHMIDGPQPTVVLVLAGVPPPCPPLQARVINW